jgi:hypothetical protein
MRRILVLALAVVTLVAVTAPAAFAQPTFKINGLIDTVTSWSSNMRNSNYTESADREWYVRNRARLNFTGEVGKAKGVVALEYDTTWGQTGTADNAGTQRPGTTSGFDLNTDVRGVTELKWLYAEFPVPLVPVPMTMRIGAQSFSETFKLATLATGDFAGLSLVATLSPNVMWSFTYVAAEERLQTGVGSRGDDYAIITNLTVTPMKGVNIRPIYAFWHAEGSTSGSARPGVVGAVAGPIHEDRHTFGVDMRWRSGPFSIDPTFFYQTGEIERAGGATTDISAWFLDVLAGWRTGPLLLEVRGIYVSGNSSGDNLNTGSDLKYYQPINTDTSYLADGWSSITALGLDYFNNLSAPLAMGSPISFDRYGRAQIGGKATYSLTPAVDFYGVVNAIWTAKKVGLVTVSPAGATPSNSSWVGVELIGGVDYRFAPGLSFGFQGAHLFAGDALKSTGPAGSSVKDVSTVAARVRFTF